MELHIIADFIYRFAEVSKAFKLTDFGKFIANTTLRTTRGWRFNSSHQIHEWKRVVAMTARFLFCLCQVIVHTISLNRQNFNIIMKY